MPKPHPSPVVAVRRLVIGILQSGLFLFFAWRLPEVFEVLMSAIGKDPTALILAVRLIFAGVSAVILVKTLFAFKKAVDESCDFAG